MAFLILIVLVAELCLDDLLDFFS